MKINQETEKIIITNIRQEAKKQGVKMISNCIYKVVGDYFAYSVFWIQCIEDKWTLFLRMNIKAYNYDNLFWTIFEMVENINSKESLRANGAYASPVFQFAEKSYELGIIEEMPKDIAKVIMDFENEIKKFAEIIKFQYGNFDLFILSKNNISDEKLIKMLANISQGNHSAAKEMAIIEMKQGNRGGYKNKGKDIYEYVVEYCDK
ncbi:MAG: hypothetical protein AB9836_11300 [Aminipila sp.]